MFMASRTAGPWRILVALLSALLAAWPGPVAIGAAADSSAAAAYAYTYVVQRGVQVASPATVRGPPSASDQDTLYDVVAARSRGASVRAGAASDSPVWKRAWVPVASARGAGFTATTLEHVRGVGGALASIGKSAVAAIAAPNERTEVAGNGAGEVYLGQSGNITSRLGQRASTGKFPQSEVHAAERIEVLGGKTAREIQEQLKQDSFGGRDASGVLNRVNPIGDRRLSLMPPGYVRP